MKELGAAGVGGERGSGLSGQLWDLLGIGGEGAGGWVWTVRLDTR